MILLPFSSREHGKCSLYAQYSLARARVCVCACAFVKNTLCVASMCVHIFSFVRCLFLFNYIIFAWSCIYCCCLFFSLFFLTSYRFFPSHFSFLVCRLFRLFVTIRFFRLLLLYSFIVLASTFAMPLYWIFIFFLLILLFFHTHNRQYTQAKLHMNTLSHTHIHNNSSHAVKIQLSVTRKKWDTHIYGMEPATP